MQHGATNPVGIDYDHDDLLPLRLGSVVGSYWSGSGETATDMA
jgi:hypothetical protein